MRIILSHVPIQTSKAVTVKEGRYTAEGGGGHDFSDRLQANEQITTLLHGLFGETGKSIGFEEFVSLNENVTSEMFLSIISLLQTCLPCATNFYRQQANYVSVMDDDYQAQGISKKTIASPNVASKLSPVSKFIASQGLNPNPQSQKQLLKYAKKASAMPNFKGQREADARSDDSVDDEENVDVSKFQSKRKLEELKKRRQQELEEYNKLAADVVDDKTAGAIRLPNRVKKGLQIDVTTGTAFQGNDEDVVMSPSFFLRGAASPDLGQQFGSTDEDEVRFNGQMIRKATETKLKKYWYALLGKELYVYKNKNDDKHRGMHNLNGVFLKDELEEYFDGKVVLHPFTLIFPGNNPRTYYLETKEAKDEWMSIIKQAIGYSSIHDFYEIKEAVGKGKSGVVKTAFHKKTGKKVAVKIMSKKEMDVSDVELQRREIEILKMCQHPNIIRLLDVFENEDFIYIVMQHLDCDLFTYLENRDFKLPESRARDLTHQMAMAVYYLHSFGIAHRDLKPENILMESNDDDAHLCIVDFGLSKMVGPSETAMDPFGTLSYVAPEVLLQQPYGKEVDLFSIGCIMYMLLCRVLPFDAHEDAEIARATI